jgi:hypothetical protein
MFMSCHIHQSFGHIYRPRREENIPSCISAGKVGSKQVKSIPINVIEDEKPIIVWFFQPQLCHREFCALLPEVAIGMADETEDFGESLVYVFDTVGGYPEDVQLSAAIE